MQGVGLYISTVRVINWQVALSVNTTQSILAIFLITFQLPPILAILCKKITCHAGPSALSSKFIVVFSTPSYQQSTITGDEQTPNHQFLRFVQLIYSAK